MSQVVSTNPPEVECPKCGYVWHEDERNVPTATLAIDPGLLDSFALIRRETKYLKLHLGASETDPLGARFDTDESAWRAILMPMKVEWDDA